MKKVGYYLIILGFIILIGYGIYNLIIDYSMPLVIKIPLLLIVLGSIIIIIIQINQRREERKEEDDSSKY